MKKLKVLLIIVLAAAALISGGMFLREKLNMAKSEREFREIEELINQGDETGDVELTAMEKYGAIYEKNPDFIGWIKIDGTKIDYPVVHTPGNTEEYIHKSFEGEYAFSGTLFTDGHCTIKENERSDNIIIYGHNMKNDSMFGTLDDYSKKSFYEEHKTFTFDTIYGYGTYEVIAVFKGDILKQDESGFRYYTFIDSEDADDFSAYISKIKSRSMYDTDATAEYGDKLLTLSTCISGRDDLRFVVVAKLIED